MFDVEPRATLSISYSDEDLGLVDGAQMTIREYVFTMAHHAAKLTDEQLLAKILLARIEGLSDDCWQSVFLRHLADARGIELPEGA